MESEVFNLENFILETLKINGQLLKRDNVSFMFPIWNKDEVIKQADELGYDYELSESQFDIFSGLVSCIHLTITVDSMLPKIEDLYGE